MRKKIGEDPISLCTMAAGTSTESVEQGDNVTLRVIVDKEKNQVVYAEAGKDFVDILFSFLTLPLGTIARLVAKESNIEAVRFGSLSSIYQSVSDLIQQHLWSQNCKEMLLKPRNSMEGHYKQLKLNIDDTPMQLFVCENRRCVSIFRNQKCICGKVLKTDYHIMNDNGFVKESSTFIIRDDLYVMPNDLGTSLYLLKKRGINHIADIEKKTILIGKKEVADLLKLSLLSKTPLTDFVLKKKPILNCNSNQNFQPKIKIGNGLPTSDSDEGKHMVVKVLRRTSTRKILFATAEEDFADFLFSFLTIPLGAVLQMLEGFSSIRCVGVDSLYRSIKELSPERCLRSQALKEELAKPYIFPKFELRSKIFPIEPCTITYIDNNQQLELIDPKSPVSGGYTRGPLAIMVTDDLVVTPLSSIDGISYLERMKIPLNDVEETVISIGLKEGLSILKASLTSTSVLTNSLNQYIGNGHVQASLSSNAASNDIMSSQRK